jgi:hypothetical protein
MNSVWPRPTFSIITMVAMLIVPGIGLGLYVRYEQDCYAICAIAGFFIPSSVWAVVVYVLTQKEARALDGAVVCANPLCSKKVYLSPTARAWRHADRSIGCSTVLTSKASPTG